MFSILARLVPNKHRSGKLDYYWPFALAAGLFAIDQYTKWLTETMLGPAVSGKEIELFGGLVLFRFVQNTGASFGMLKDYSWLFTLLAAAVGLGIISWYIVRGTTDRWYQFCTGMLFAGIVSNLFDRLFKNGAVTDTIHLPWLEIFKNFNLADVTITFGVITLLVVTLVRYRRDQNKVTTSSN